MEPSNATPPLPSSPQASDSRLEVPNPAVKAAAAFPIGRSILKVVLPYALLAALWIYYSDALVARLAANSAQALVWSTLKGWLFVVVTSGLLAGLVLRLTRQLAQAWNALQERDALLREVSARAHIGGWEFDPLTGQSTCTEELVRIHDLAPDTPPGVPLGLSFFTEASRHRLEAAVREAVQHGRSYDLELELLSAKGAHKWVRAQGFACIREGRVVKVRGNLQDITLQKQAQEKIEQLNAQLEQRVHERTAQLEAANRELEAFTYSVSHDLRAPLRAIDGFSGILAAEHARDLDADGLELLERISLATRRMGQLIDDLLSLSRVGRNALKLSRLDMQSLAKAAFEECLERASGRTVQLHLDALPPAQGDPGLLRQVWVNLLSNALKYTQPRAGARIEIGGRLEAGEALYWVKDNGVGFDMQFAGKLFGIFQRLHSAAQFEGNGVGLALVQRIVQRHGGRVWAESQLDVGATFFFTLPAPPPS